jgi:hypothetical protein
VLLLCTLEIAAAEFAQWLDFLSVQTYAAVVNRPRPHSIKRIFMRRTQHGHTLFICYISELCHLKSFDELCSGKLLLFIRGLFNDTFNRLDNIASGWLVKNRLERICKDALVAYFEVLTWYVPGETNENFSTSQVKILWMVSQPWMKPGTSRIQIRSVASRLSLLIAKLFLYVLVLWATLTSQDSNKTLVAFPGTVLNVLTMHGH